MSFVLIIAFFYFILIVFLIIGFNKIEIFNLNNKKAIKEFTIIIPFRNEKKNLPKLIKSLTQLNYPTSLFEVIFINDDSTDKSIQLINPFLLKNKHWKLLNNQRKSNSPKKDAINTAINIAKHEWIITTDADCEVPKNWLQCLNNFILLQQKKSSVINMIVGPVAYKTDTSFLQNFQNIDFLSLIGSTIGGFGIGKPFLCNGANLCYKKEVFLTVNGFEGNDTIASGDDVFLMDKILVNYPNSVHYLKSKDAIVVTKPETTFKGLLSQRIRWASKTSATKNLFGKFIGIVVFLINLISVWFFVFGLWFSKYKLLFLVIIILKFIFDFVLIQKTAQFFKNIKTLRFYPFSAIFYPFFVIFVVFSSLFKKYEWKGRRFKK